MDDTDTNSRAKQVAEQVAAGQMSRMDAWIALSELIESSPIPRQVAQKLMPGFHDQAVTDAERRLKDQLVERCLQGHLFDLDKLAAGYEFDAFLWRVCAGSKRLLFTRQPPLLSVPAETEDAGQGTWVDDMAQDMSHRTSPAEKIDVAARILAVMWGVRRLFCPVTCQDQTLAAQQTSEDPAVLRAAAQARLDGQPGGVVGQTLRYHQPADLEALKDLDDLALAALARPLAQVQPKVTKVIAAKTKDLFGWDQLSSQTATAWCRWQSYADDAQMRGGKRKPDAQIAAELADFEQQATVLCQLSRFRTVAEVDEAANLAYLQAVATVQAGRWDRKLGLPPSSPPTCQA